MFEAWLSAACFRARLPDTVDFVLSDLFSIFACIRAQRSINFIGLKIYNNNFKKKDQKGIARTGGSTTEI